MSAPHDVYDPELHGYADPPPPRWGTAIAIGLTIVLLIAVAAYFGPLYPLVLLTGMLAAMLMTTKKEG